MSSKHTADAAKIIDQPVSDKMRDSYLDYSMAVIGGRAIPDVRDGLKPVNRRILYAMDQLGAGPNSGHYKSSKVVGETMGDYHPHGDSSIYDALVRMGQTFSLRHVLIDGQGNFGSLDGDPAAAMRYTEARMSSLSTELLEDMTYDTVDMVPNYDGRTEQPEVLPSRFPNLLINGSKGIAVGMSTTIPPHNMQEVYDALELHIEEDEVTVDDYMEVLSGPDFPTGGVICGTEGIREAYETGSGRFRVRANYEIEEDGTIVITEIPYGPDKKDIVSDIVDAVDNDTIPEIVDLIDQSDNHGVRIELKIRNDAIPEVVINKLFEHGILEKTVGVNFLAIVNDKPQTLSLKEYFDEFVDFRREVIRRRTQDKLTQAKDRYHLLEGRQKAIDAIDTVIDLIQDSESTEVAKEKLIDELDLTQDQADHIARMQLRSLTSMEMQDMREEKEELERDIEEYNELLSSTDNIDEVLLEEFKSIVDNYGDERKTAIEQASSVSREDLIPEKESVFVITEDNYAKRVALEEFRSQSRGGKGVIGTDVKQGDTVTAFTVASSHDELLLVTNKGNLYKINGYDIQESSRTARGGHLANVEDLMLDDEEYVVEIETTSDIDEESYVVVATENGYGFKTDAQEFSKVYRSGLQLVNLEDDDTVVSVEVVGEEHGEVIVSTAERTVRFDLDDMSSVNRGARGSMLIETDQPVHSCSVSSDPQCVLSVAQNGKGRLTDHDEYRKTSRYSKGVLDMKGEVEFTRFVDGDEEIVLYRDDERILRFPVDDISNVGRRSKGVILTRDSGIQQVDIN